MSYQTDKYARVIEERNQLLAALQWLHPRAGTWRTPDDEKAAEIEAIILKVTGAGQAPNFVG